MLSGWFAKFSWGATKELLFSPLGMVAVIIVVWVASGWKHTIEARFECNTRVAKLQADAEAEVAAAKKENDARLAAATRQAARDAQENRERAARDKQELEDYAKSLEGKLAGACLLGDTGVRALRVR